MSLKTKDEIQRLFSQFVRDALAAVPTEERARYQEEFQKRAEELVRVGADGCGPTAFLDLVGLGAKGPVAFDGRSATQRLSRTSTTPSSRASSTQRPSCTTSISTSA